jgi:hypothetical protein
VPQTPLVARVLRALIAGLVVAAVVATVADVASQTGINPFNFFGFFTIQSNLILAAVYLLSALAPAALGEPTRSLVRAAATTYIVIVGIVYATLLAPARGSRGRAGPVGQRGATRRHAGVRHRRLARLSGPRAVALGRLWGVLLYPAVWLVVVLLRGATDGWVPTRSWTPSRGTRRSPATAWSSSSRSVVVGAVVFCGTRIGGRVVSPTAS